MIVNSTPQEIHSKLKTMAFPDFEEVVRIVQETSKGAEPTPVNIRTE